MGIQSSAARQSAQWPLARNAPPPRSHHLTAEQLRLLDCLLLSLLHRLIIITSRPSSSDDFSIVSVSDDSTAVYRCAVLSEMWHEILRTCARAPIYEGSDHLHTR